MNAAIILARLDSNRLPNKALLDLSNKKIIEWVIDTLNESDAFTTILATSDMPEDKPLIEFAEKKGILGFAGNKLDIAKRVIDCCENFQINNFARVNGDSPLIMRNLIENGFNILKESDCDFVTNLLPRKFPYGISVEIFRFEFFKNNYPFFKTSHNREHVSNYFYENISHFNVHKIAYDENRNDHDVRLTVDNYEDYVKMNELLKSLDINEMQDIQSIIKKYKELNL